MKPGLEIAELYSRAMDKRTELSDLSQVKTFLGNSIGINLREPPFLIADSQSHLRENMVLSVSPSSYAEGVGGAKIADIFLVASDGSTNLSGLARETI